MTYWPAPSRGNLWLGLTAGVLLVLGAYCLWLGWATETPFVSMIGLLPIGAGLIVLPYVFWFSSLRYELGDGELVLRCGPYRYRVGLADITSIDRRDLAFTFLPGMRLPGFALGEMEYGKIGSVVMCSTRALKGVTIVGTSLKKYGLTPADEEGFLADLKSRLGSPRSAACGTARARRGGAGPYGPSRSRRGGRARLSSAGPRE